MNEEQFKKAISLLANFKVRSEITLEEIPAPQRLAKFSYALSADVSNGLLGDNEAELANGRFVVLHEPGGQDSWEGEFRCVTFLNADLDNDEADEDAGFSFNNKPNGVSQFILDFVEANGLVSYTEMNDMYKAYTKGSNSFSHILKALTIPYKNRPTRRYLIKHHTGGYFVGTATERNWVVVND